MINSFIYKVSENFINVTSECYPMFEFLKIETLYYHAKDNFIVLKICCIFSYFYLFANFLAFFFFFLIEQIRVERLIAFKFTFQKVTS